MAALLVDAAGVRSALPLEAVSEIFRAARVEPVPSGPPEVLGVLAVRGQPVAVVDLVRILGDRGGPLRPSDRFVLLAGTHPRIALRVEHAHDITELAVHRHHGDDGLHDALGAIGVAVLEDGLVLVHDPASFVVAADHDALRQALAEVQPA